MLNLILALKEILNLRQQTHTYLSNSNVNQEEEVDLPPRHCMALLSCLWAMPGYTEEHKTYISFEEAS